MGTLLAWDADKPHRCPSCWAVAVDMERPKWWRLYTCCRCGVLFCRWPLLSPVLHDAGIRCTEHRGDFVNVTIRLPRAVFERARVQAVWHTDLTVNDYIAAGLIARLTSDE